MEKEEAMHALIRALIVSDMHAAKRIDVAGLPGVSVSFGGRGDAFAPRRLFVKLPNWNETWTDLSGTAHEEIAACAADFPGLAAGGDSEGAE
jgi:hypothetical protein